MNDRVAVWYGCYGAELLRYVRRLMGNHPDAEDIHARVFLEALRCADRLTDAPRPWLYFVARSRVVDWMRQERRHMTLPLFEEYVGSAMEDAIIDRLWLTDVCQVLSPRYRAVLQLRYVEGYSIKQTAQRLGVTSMAVRALTHRAIVAVQATL